MGKGQRSGSERPDGRGGEFRMMPLCLLKSEAWRTADFRERAALLVLFERHRGFNNGRISMSADELAEGLNCWNHRGNAQAIGGLIARGFVVLMKDHPRGSRLAREYRLTFIPSKDGPATHDYLNWRLGDAGTRKKRVVMTATERASSVAMTTTETKLSSAVTATEEKPNDGKQPIFQKGSVAAIATHIVSHTRPIRTGLPDAMGKPGGRSVAPAGGDKSAAPSVDDLRERALAFIDEYGRGSQGRLADLAGIPAGTFSRFLKNEGPLGYRARILLACAFPKAEAALAA